MVDKLSLIGAQGVFGLHEKSQESLPEMLWDSICLYGYDRSPSKVPYRQLKDGV